MRDRGEVEAVVQASPFGAVVIVDDAWGRALAGNFGLEVHGTLWVLQQFRELELISSTAFRDCFISLRQRGIRLPWETVNDLLRESGESPL
jgi:predicted nucleic acid-binding protein